MVANKTLETHKFQETHQTNDTEMKFRPALFICDIQERFRSTIFGYDQVISTANRMLKAAKILDLPVYVTTQSRAKLGETVKELDVSRAVINTDKTKFSMMTPEVAQKLPRGTPVAMVGIESHVCVLQTTLDLLKSGHPVYLLTDGISSANREEQPIALKRLARQGAIVTTSESFLFEAMGDAKIDQFRAISALIKEEKNQTRQALETLARL
ncbi:hypothetical protein TRVA0_001S01090 [Trichomonascus vanleenenianus]|uniref:uncharacterized protein n=1 Tax=Trichomonascus vanleenenianus TaxID=2268995 RepID=UPI003ECA1324